MTTAKASAAILSVLLLGGCVPNLYRDTFVPSGTVLPEGGASCGVKMRMADPDSVRQLVSQAMSEGWIVVGQSGFNGMHNPWSKAIDLAKDKNADLVILCENFTNMGERDAIALDTVYVHTYEFGNVNIWHRGRHRSRPYSGFTTTAVSHARPIKIPVRLYDQSAVFLKRDSGSGKFGLILSYKPRTPDVPSTAPVEVSVAVVVKNSPAARQGIAPGDKVVNLNGVAIKTYADLAKALGAAEVIRSAQTIPAKGAAK